MPAAVRADGGERSAPASVPAVGSCSGPGDPPPAPSPARARRDGDGCGGTGGASPGPGAGRGGGTASRGGERGGSGRWRARAGDESPAGVPSRGERALMPPVGDRSVGFRGRTQGCRSGPGSHTRHGDECGHPGLPHSRRGRSRPHARRPTRARGDDGLRRPSGPRTRSPAATGPSGCSAAAARRRSGSRTTSRSSAPWRDRAGAPGRRRRAAARARCGARRG